MMTDRPQPENRITRASGIVVFLVDESTSTDARIAGGTKSKAQSLATALNSLLNQLSAVGQVDVALIGYRGTAEGGMDVGSRWAGPLAGNDFVAIDRVSASPTTVENRVRKIPAPGGVGVFREETVRFPIWYVPKLGPAVGCDGAIDACRAVLERWLATSGPTPKPPMIFHFHADDALPQAAKASFEQLATLSTSVGPPLWFHAHLGSSTRIPATLYPSTDDHLTYEMVRDLFGQSSLLPPPFVAALNALQIPVNPGARGLLHNGRMVDLIRFFSLAKTYVALPAEVQPSVYERQAQRQAPTGSDPAVALMLVLDRSVDERYVEETRNVCQRLQDEANDLLTKIAKRKSRQMSIGVVAYGTGSTGELEIEIGFSGPLAGRPLVDDVDLIEGAIREEEVCEQVSNGIGGLIEITRKKSIYLDFPPAKAASLVPAFHAVRDLLAPWRETHRQSALGAIILHLTRGEFDPVEVDEAIRSLDVIQQVTPLVYHLIFTEPPHRSVAYPDDPSRLDRPILAKLYQWTGPLLGSERLAASRPNVTPQSRGMVVNGRFDLLLEGLDAITLDPDP